jgi:hypothetical protein
VASTIPYSIATAENLKDADVIKIALSDDPATLETALSVGALNASTDESSVELRLLTITAPDIAKLTQAKDWVRAVKMTSGVRDPNRAIRI